MKFSFHNPYDPEFLGSGHHRIIEASAGTGKTHFIEEQVLFWILHGAHLSQRKHQSRNTQSENPIRRILKVKNLKSKRNREFKML